MKKSYVLVAIVLVMGLVLTACGGSFKQELNKQIKTAGEDVAAGRDAMARVLDAEFAKEGYPSGIVGVQFGTTYGAALDDGGLKPIPRKTLFIAIPNPSDQMGWSEQEKQKIIDIMQICEAYAESLDFHGWLYVNENFEEFPVE